MVDTGENILHFRTYNYVRKLRAREKDKKSIAANYTYLTTTTKPHEHLKLPWICHFLWHSAKKRVWLILTSQHRTERTKWCNWNARTSSYRTSHQMTSVVHSQNTFLTINHHSRFWRQCNQLLRRRLGDWNTDAINFCYNQMARRWLTGYYFVETMCSTVNLEIETNTSKS